MEVVGGGGSWARRARRCGSSLGRFFGRFLMAATENVMELCNRVLWRVEATHFEVVDAVGGRGWWW